MYIYKTKIIKHHCVRSVMVHMRRFDRAFTGCLNCKYQNHMHLLDWFFFFSVKMAPKSVELSRCCLGIIIMAGLSFYFVCGEEEEAKRSNPVYSFLKAQRLRSRAKGFLTVGYVTIFIQLLYFVVGHLICRQTYFVMTFCLCSQRTRESSPQNNDPPPPHTHTHAHRQSTSQYNTMTFLFYARTFAAINLFYNILSNVSY